MWLILSVIGYGVLAVVSILDKYLLSSAKVQPALYTFYSTAFILPVVFLYPFGVHNLNSVGDYFWALFCGLTFALALWTMFLGFETSEVSHLGPLIGASTPVFALIFSRLFLAEILSAHKLVACALLIAGSLLISFEKSKNHRGWHIGMLWGVLAGLFFAASNVSAKYFYDAYGFLTGFFWTRVAIGIVGLFFFFHPQVFQAIFHPALWDKIKAKFSWHRQRDSLVLVGADKILGVVGVVLIQYAIAIGSVSLVNALNGLQFAFLVILVILLSKFSPRKFKEDYEKGEVAQEILAVAVIMVGLILLV